MAQRELTLIAVSAVDCKGIHKATGLPFFNKLTEPVLVHSYNNGHTEVLCRYIHASSCHFLEDMAVKKQSNNGYPNCPYSR